MAAAARTAATTAGAIGGCSAAATTPYMSYRGPKGLVFLGSWFGDSVLMQLRPRKPAEGLEGPEGLQSKPAATDLKRGRREDGGVGGEDGVAAATNRSAVVEAAAAAFASSAAAAGAAGLAPRYNLRLLDSLPSLGE